MQSNNKKVKNSIDVPEIPANADLKPLHRRPAKNVILPEEGVRVIFKKHILSWFRMEARRQKSNVDLLINEALRQFIVQQSMSSNDRKNGLNTAQKAEVETIVREILARKREPQPVEST